jgi:drug/metabolite transporter (DMT)-like permease
MSKYALGILLSFAAPTLHAGANILDAYFANKIFQRLGTLVMFSALMNALFLPIICFIDAPMLISANLLGIAIIIAAIEVGYQYPYFWALRRLDTSVVTSLFSLGKLSTPLLALAFVGEKLTLLQYLGFCIIMVCSAFLTFDFKKLHINHALWLMLAVSSGLSLQAVLYKYAFEHGAGWGSMMVWSTGAEVVIAGALLLVRNNSEDLKSSGARIRRAAPLMLISQALTWTGGVAGVYALVLIPVSVVKGIDGTQAIYALLLALLFSKGSASRYFRERLETHSLIKKSVLLFLVGAGAWLVSVQF